MLCQKCGSSMDDNAVFCFNCGNVSDNGVSLKKPAASMCGKAPEFGKQLSAEDNLDPHYKKVDLAVGILRWAFCIRWIIECFKGSGIISALVLSALCIYFTSLMEKLIMVVYQYLRKEHFQNAKYSSYVDTYESEIIVSILAEPLSAHGIDISVNSKSMYRGVVEITYSSRMYTAVFYARTKDRCHFVILNGENSYVDICSDVPFIVYHIQDVLKNL